MTRYLTAALILLTSLSIASPLQYELSDNLNKRQAIPDQFGNTGSKPTFSSLVHPQPFTTTVSVVATPRVPRPSSTSASTSTATSAVGSVVSTSLHDATSSIAQTPYYPSPTSSPTPSASSPSPWIQLHGSKPPPLLSRAGIVGISVGSVAFVALLAGILLFLRHRRKAHEIIEITTPHIKPAKPYGAHYNAKIARSRSWKLKQDEISGSSVSSWGSLGKNKLIHTYNSPVSPSVYSRRTTLLSGMRSGEIDRWQDARLHKVFTGTPSQLMDAPRPLFVGVAKKLNEDSDTRDIRRPRPVKPAGVKPPDRPSGQVHGLGLR